MIYATLTPYFQFSSSHAEPSRPIPTDAYPVATTGADGTLASTPNAIAIHAESVIVLSCFALSITLEKEI
ncbi:hypothetical protein LC609_31075 [Nostoc sp. XA013]|nr:hypothetical protein [Nostoc sp. XA013]